MESGDLSKLTLVQLRAELKKKNLSTSGTKKELVERLKGVPAVDGHESKETEEKDGADVVPKSSEEGDKKEEAKEDKAKEEEKEKEKEAPKRRGRSAARKEEKKEEKKEGEEKEKKVTNKRKRGAKEEKEEKKEEKEEEKEEKEEKEKEEKEEEEPKQKKGKKEKEAAVVAPTSSISYADWKWDGTLFFWETPGVKHSDKLACFDYDGCLAKTSLFKKGPDAWSVLYPEVTTKLKALHEEGYKLVIMTNQSDIGKAASPQSREKFITEKVGRLTGFVSQIGLPFQVFVATGKNKVPDLYRKPATGMWTYLIEKSNGGIQPDMGKCFFVGDAAGRKKDHSDTDKAFAEAAKLKFYTETQYFLGKAD